MDPLLPKKEGVCDACGHELIIREDDTEKVIRSRMEEYEAKTRPLLLEFEKMGVLINCEAKKGVKDYPEIKKMVETKIAASG
jgi:adenylate kinase